MQHLQNKAQLIGYVGADPEIVTLKSGNKKAEFKLATHRSYKTKSGDAVEETDWHRVVIFGSLVGIVENFVVKGSHIGIEGRISNRSYEASDGSKRYISEIVCNELLLLGSRSSSTDKLFEQKERIKT